MPLIAKIAVSAATYAIDKPYDYLVPEELERRIQPGMRVLVPFGSGNRPCDGIVLAVVLWCLTNVVKKTKKWHPIVFIGISALVGILFQMG